MLAFWPKCGNFFMLSEGEKIEKEEKKGRKRREKRRKEEKNLFGGSNFESDLFFEAIYAETKFR